MGKETWFNLSCGGTVFYILGGVYLAAKTEHGWAGGVFILIGTGFLAIALVEGVKPTDR